MKRSKGNACHGQGKSAGFPKTTQSQLQLASHMSTLYTWSTRKIWRARSDVTIYVCDLTCTIWRVRSAVNYLACTIWRVRSDVTIWRVWAENRTPYKIHVLLICIICGKMLSWKGQPKSTRVKPVKSRFLTYDIFFNTKGDLPKIRCLFKCCAGFSCTYKKCSSPSTRINKEFQMNKKCLCSIFRDMRHAT